MASLMVAIGREDLASDPRFSTNQGRADNVEYLDSEIENWTKTLTLKEVQALLDQASVPVGPIYGIKEIVEDEHYKARGMLQEVELPDGKKVLVPGVVPKLSETPGTIEWNGPSLGEHNEEVYTEFMNFSFEQFRELKEKGVI